MELDRRKAMGGIVGGALLGPKAAQRAVEQIADMAKLDTDAIAAAKAYAREYNTKAAGLAWQKEQDVVNRDWYVDQIAKLKERLLGIGGKDPLYDRSWSEVKKAELKSMRSISPVNKARMHAEWNEAQHEQRDRDEILSSIARYTKEMMGL
jgi:hypothetical protein